MTSIRQAWARLLSIFKRRPLDQEFDEEAQSHLTLAIEEYMAEGLALADAQRLARVKFGSHASAKDAHRDSRGLPRLEGLVYDLRLAIRGLRRDRVFSLAAIAMLTLAIGLNVTAFTVMDAMLFRGLPLAKRPAAVPGDAKAVGPAVLSRSADLFRF